MTEQIMSNDDEIDLREYFKLIFRYKYFLLLVIGVAMLGCLYFNHVAKSRYAVVSSFIVPTDDGGGGLMGYAKLFGVGRQGSVGDYVVSLLKSRKMQDKITLDLAKTCPGKAVGNLKTRMKIIRDPNGVFILQYENEDPQIAFEVVRSGLANLVLFNQELELSVQKKVITILDEPRLPEKPTWPNRHLNLMLTFVSSLFVGIFLIFLMDYFRRG